MVDVNSCLFLEAYFPLRLRVAADRRYRLFDRALQRACAMWPADAGCAYWLGMLAAGGLLVVVGLL